MPSFFLLTPFNFPSAAGGELVLRLLFGLSIFVQNLRNKKGKTNSMVISNSHPFKGWDDLSIATVRVGCEAS